MWVSEEERNYHAGQEKRWEAIKASRKGKRKSKKSRKKRRDLRSKNRAEIVASEKRCRAYLKDFWDIFNTGKVDKMRLLQIAANPGWSRIDNAFRLRLRKAFSRQYTQYLVGISEECAICCGRKWIEKHHIVPLAYGGINDNLNLLGICMPCHDEIHPWMKGN